MSQTQDRYTFRFVPFLATKSAWDNRPFREFYDMGDFKRALLKYELENKHTQMMGLIRFKKGTVSKYLDGTEGRTHDDRKWWELGYTSCPGQCCFLPYDPRWYSWKPAPEGSSEEVVAAAAAELKAISDEMKQIQETNYQKHLANPKPMPKFKRKSIPPIREWQEFRRIKGPGGLVEQIELIANFEDVEKISLTNLGWFYIEKV